MVKRSIPERIGSGLLAVAVAFLCVFWSLRPVNVCAIDDYTESQINYALELFKSISETAILEYTSLDPTTLKIAEAELSFATHIAFSSLERDLVEQGVNFDPSFTGWNNICGFYYFNSGDGTPELSVGTLSWKQDLEACRIKFASSHLGAFMWCSSAHNKVDALPDGSDFFVSARSNGGSNLMQYWTNLSGFDSPFGFSSSEMSSPYYNISGISPYIWATFRPIPTHSNTSPYWQLNETDTGGYYQQYGSLDMRAFASTTPYQFPDTGSIDPQTNYQAVLDDVLTTYGQEEVDKIWIPADFNNIPPVFDQFVFPGNLPGVTFPDVNLPETTLPETLWNSLAFYFQTFDQVATETGAKPVLVIFLIIALLCVMLKI